MEQGHLLKVKERKIFPDLEEIEIYHDEVYDDDEKPFGHQFLIIPVRSKDFLNKALTYSRKKFKAENLTINWKKLDKKHNKNRNLVAQEWLKIIYNATYNKPFKYIIDKKVEDFGLLGVRVGSVFIKSIKELSDDFWIHVKNDKERSRRKYETLLRIGMQGVLHFCFNPDYTNYTKIMVKNFYTDGEVFGKIPLDKNRVIKRLEEKCREYIEISSDIKITPVLKNKIKNPEVNFEELTDLVLGSTYYLCGDEKQSWREMIVESLAKMYNKSKRNKIGFESSPHFRSFTITQCKINDNDEISFEERKVNDLSKDNEFQEKLIF